MKGNAPTTWILVAHRAGARIFAQQPRRRELESVLTVEHPEGRLKAAELNTDGPGLSFQSGGPGQHRMVPPQRVTDHVADQFARSLADVLERGRTQGAFEGVVLIAPPRFLGRLRSALTRPLSDVVVGTVNRDLPEAEEPEVRRALESLEPTEARRPNGT